MNKTEKTGLCYFSEGSGRPVVLLHGNGESHEIFSIMIKQLLEAGYQVIAPDSPGQGANEPLTEYHYADMADRIYQFMKELGLEKPVLYGFSDGGIIALMIAINHPGELSALAVSGANLSPAGLEPSFIKEYEDKQDDPLVKLMFSEPDIDPADLQKIDIPVLVTAGSEDLILPSETQKIADHIPNSTLAILEGEEHGSYIEDSEMMGALLVEFLKTGTTGTLLMV